MIKNRHFALHTIDKTANEATIYIYGGIPDIDWNDSTFINTSREFIKEFKALEAEYDVINIRINSPGGFVDEGLGMFNTISQSKATINTYNDGVAASMAAVLLMAGDNVYGAKNSLTMIHNVWGMTVGTANDLREAAEVSDKFDQVLISAFADKMGKSEAAIKAKYFDYKDHWFTASEAETEGILKVITKEAVLDKSISKNMSLKDLQGVFKKAASINNVSKPNDNMNILELFGFSSETANKLSAEDKQRLESAEEKLTSMEGAHNAAISDLAKANEVKGTLAAQVTELEKSIADNATAHTAALAAKDAEIAELQAKLDKKPAAAATTATTEAGEDRHATSDKAIPSYQQKAINKTKNLKK